jgi:hypothetical protein
MRRLTAGAFHSEVRLPSLGNGLGGSGWKAPTHHLTLEERRTLFRLLGAKLPIKEIVAQQFEAGAMLQSGSPTSASA